jgi:hypothetical protein
MNPNATAIFVVAVPPIVLALLLTIARMVQP